MPAKFIKNLATRQEIATKLDADIGKAVALLETAIANRTPVRTGNLKGSMTGRKTGWAKGEVATNVPYAEYVEFGTVKMSPRAMMRQGANALEKRTVGILKKRRDYSQQNKRRRYLPYLPASRTR